MFEIPLRQENRLIFHVDADSFFASVEQVLNPELKGQAILIGGSETRGIVSTASYEAKKFGIYSGMPMYQARKLCPHAKIVKGSFQEYKKFSKRMYEVFCAYSPDVEMVSIDEAYLDLSGCSEMFKRTPNQLAKDILFRINKELGISVSGGLGSSKTIAKIASSTNKPHKLTVVPFGKEMDFLNELPVSVMPGVGPRSFEILKMYGLNKLGDINKLGLTEILSKFGMSFIGLWKRSMGIDNRQVRSSQRTPLSISNENTFFHPIYDQQEAIKKLQQLTNKVCWRLRIQGMKAQTVSLKLRYKTNNHSKYKKGFKNKSFQTVLSYPCSTEKKIFPVVKSLFFQNVESKYPIRLMGICLSGLVKKYNLVLFENFMEEEKLFGAIDEIRNNSGKDIISYGT